MPSASSATRKSNSTWPDSGFQRAPPSRTTMRLPSAAMATPVSGRPSGSCCLSRASARLTRAGAMRAAVSPAAVRNRTTSWKLKRGVPSSSSAGARKPSRTYDCTWRTDTPSSFATSCAE